MLPEAGIAGAARLFGLSRYQGFGLPGGNASLGSGDKPHRFRAGCGGHQSLGQYDLLSRRSLPVKPQHAARSCRLLAPESPAVGMAVEHFTLRCLRVRGLAQGTKLLLQQFQLVCQQSHTDADVAVLPRRAPVSRWYSARMAVR